MILVSLTTLQLRARWLFSQSNFCAYDIDLSNGPWLLKRLRMDPRSTMTPCRHRSDHKLPATMTESNALVPAAQSDSTRDESSQADTTGEVGLQLRTAKGMHVQRNRLHKRVSRFGIRHSFVGLSPGQATCASGRSARTSATADYLHSRPGDDK
jgi:hypothetical protein